ncbi:MAG TPA: DNA-formamidopyrimidine glycosylase family protein [Actinospica sp.]|nr:DNA-formamidopyrimidine glycosylase family protein [Actinospica sp.]
MPEGDTVWQTAARLDDALAGHPLTRCDLRVPKLATVDFTGEVVESVQPRGKHLLTRFRNGWTLHSHLRMDGSWRIFDSGESWRGGPAHQIRAILGNTSRTAVGYRLPVLELLRTADERRAVGHLGPDLLDPGWSPELAAEAVRRLTAQPYRPIGEALLDQRNLAGIGNVYKSELCFLTGVTPWTPVSGVPALPELVDRAHRLLLANRDRPMRITTGETRTGRTLWVYGRKRGQCLRCAAPIRSADQGAAGEERVTYWCPGCQQGPSR